jgi:hypothetical protein
MAAQRAAILNHAVRLGEWSKLGLPLVRGQLQRSFPTLRFQPSMQCDLPLMRDTASWSMLSATSLRLSTRTFAPSRRLEGMFAVQCVRTRPPGALLSR